MILQFDSPALFDAAVTNIPAINQAPIEVVHSLATKTNRVHIIDAIGEYFDVLIGPIGQETLLRTIGNRNEITFAKEIPEGSRISLRSKSDAIIKGTLCLSFYYQWGNS